NQGYHTLHGDDFGNVFHSRGLHDPSRLPPYVEFVKRRDSSPLRGNDLLQTSLGLLRRQLSFVPAANPFAKFKSRFEADLKWLTVETLDMFHRYSFATLRQFGACFELSATYLKWLQQQN